MEGIQEIIKWVTANWASVLQILAAVYGLLALIVKVFPTLNGGPILWLLKVLGKITNRQVKDSEVRAARVAPPTPPPTQ